jgi:hypothetical protein
MAAPKNNSFWELRTKHGRDKIFESPDMFLKAAYEYFKEVDKNPWYHNEVVKSGKDAGKVLPIPTSRPYTIEALCVFLGITYQTFLNYETSDTHKDFFEVFTHVREVIENNQFEGATVGAYNANIIARKLGLSDKVDAKQTNITYNVSVSKEEAKQISDALEEEC